MKTTKTWVKRAVRTFGQTFFGTISTGIVAAVSGVSDMNALKVAIVSLVASALASAASAAMNLREE